MFSRPVSSGWKPVPTSSRLPTRPWISTRPVGRLGDARQDLQQRPLAGAVAADDADDLAVRDLERHVPQRPERSLRLGDRRRRWLEQRAEAPERSRHRIGDVSRKRPVAAPACRCGYALAEAVDANGRSSLIRQVGERPSPSAGSRTGRRRAGPPRRRPTADQERQSRAMRLPEQRPAEALDHAGHRVQPEIRRATARARCCSGRRPASRTSRTASGTGST